MLYPQAIAILLVIVDLTSSLPQDGLVAVTGGTTEAAATMPLRCVTGKHVVGTCVKRERCDYGTTAIDFTLYRPRGYTLSCLSGDVCCPPEFLLQHDDTVWVPDQEEFNFGDDD